jgi:hypothetical protein
MLAVQKLVRAWARASNVLAGRSLTAPCTACGRLMQAVSVGCGCRSGRLIPVRWCLEARPSKLYTPPATSRRVCPRPARWPPTQASDEQLLHWVEGCGALAKINGMWGFLAGEYLRDCLETLRPLSNRHARRRAPALRTELLGERAALVHGAAMGGALWAAGPLVRAHAFGTQDSCSRPSARGFSLALLSPAAEPHPDPRNPRPQTTRGARWPRGWRATPRLPPGTCAGPSGATPTPSCWTAVTSAPSTTWVAPRWQR